VSIYLTAALGVVFLQRFEEGLHPPLVLLVRRICRCCSS
jgi:hypothetical protein